MSLYQVAALLRADENAGIEETMLLPPVNLLAKNEKAASMKAIYKFEQLRNLDEADAERLEIVVRPF